MYENCYICYGKGYCWNISKVSSICNDCNVNILDITQSVLDDIFVMVMLTDISKSNCDFAKFSDRLKSMGTENALDVRVMHEDVFNSMHRI